MRWGADAQARAAGARHVSASLLSAAWSAGARSTPTEDVDSAAERILRERLPTGGDVQSTLATLDRI